MLTSINRSIRNFHVEVVKWTSKKCTKQRHRRSEVLFCPQNNFFDVHVAIDVEVQSGDISIRHFQYGGVCLHFTRASFNTVFGKSNSKITLKYLVRRPFFLITLSRRSVIKVSYIILFDVPPHAVDFTQKIIFGSDIYRELL